MEIWLNVARLAAAVNIVLLLALGSVWLRNYWAHRANHTLGLLVFASFLLIQNTLWLYFYVVHPGFVGWYANTSTDIQIGVSLLCGLELVALLALVRITWV